MYSSSRYEEKSGIEIKLPWETNTARGFGISIVMLIAFLIIVPWVHLTPKKPREIQINTIPITLLNFGEGDGTGMSKGNLTREGAMNKGSKPNSDLEDAKIAGETKPGKSTDSDNLSNNLLAVKNLQSDLNNTNANKGNDSRNIGNPNGTDGGTGLGDKGIGKGKGMGFGDIEWGGGGNRIVLYKKVPSFPDGVNTSAQIKMKFTVQPDGTVSSVIPMQKADPRLERAAMDALRQWRFNALKDDVVMVGIIPLNFMLR